MAKFTDFETRYLNTLIDQAISTEQHPMIKEVGQLVKVKLNSKAATGTRRKKGEAPAGAAQKKA